MVKVAVILKRKPGMNRPVRQPGGSGPDLEVVRPDEHKFLDLANCIFMVTEEVSMKS